MIIQAADTGIPFSTSITGVVGAVAGLITALALVLAALPALIKTLRAVENVEAKVQEVHVLVNQQKTDLENYQRMLVSELKKAGVDVPVDQSKSSTSGS